MPGQTPSQPGWYPDQNGAMRWFDGSSWTDHVQPGAAEPNPPTAPLAQQPGWQQHPQQPPPPQQPPQSPYGAVPQPGAPGSPGGPGGPGGPWQPGPPPGSRGGGNKVLFIVLGVIGALLLVAALAVGAFAVFGGDDDGDDDNGGDSSSLPDTSPEEVTEDFFEAALAGDCDAAEDLVTQRFLDQEGDCNLEDMPEQFDYEVGDAEIDEEAETATVPVTLSAEGQSEPVDLLMIIEDDEWKIDDFGESGGAEPTATTDTAEPSEFSTDDLPSIPTEGLPSGFPSDLPTDPEELESYFSEYLSDYLTATP